MSIRPSAQYRNQLQTTPSHFVVIGDTSLAVIYTAKLFETFKNDSPRPTIWLITSGTDNTVDVNVESLDYVLINNASIYRSLISHRVHLIQNTSESINSSLSSADVFFDQYYNFHTGSAFLGDQVVSYYQPMVGPWFTSDSKGKLQNFVKDSTMQFPLTQNEMIVATNIANFLHLSMSTSVIATKPTILTKNYIFVYQQGHKLERQIYRDVYVDLTNESSVNLVSQTNNLRLEATTSCLYNVKYTTLRDDVTVTIPNASVLFMNNLYEYVKLMGISDVPHKKVNVPVSYRIVFTINQVNPMTGVNLSNLNPAEYPLNLGDGLTTRLTMAVTDVPEPGEKMNSTTPTWLISAYTTLEDLANPGAGGTFAAAGKSLLIVEGISLTNRRVFSYDDINMAVSVNLNPNNTELGRYGKFLLIAANIFQAYTGSPPLIPLTNTICTNEGLCTDTNQIEHSSNRETPQVLVMRLLVSLFGSSATTYPTPNTISTVCN